MRKKLAVLISNAGTGSNLQAIIDAIKENKLRAEIAVVISSDEDAYGLTRAKNNNIPTALCPKKDQLLSLVGKYSPDYIVLAGWKQFITDEFIDVYANKILNLHPGIIPDSFDGSFENPDGTEGVWNKGMLTDRAIQNFFNQKATFAGSSIHFLTHEFDFGPVLGRCFEKIEPGDTIESLYARLKKKENELYVEVLKKLCD